MGEYALVEAFCNDKDCDCRRVMFNFVTPENHKTVAAIAYGWETEKFYTKWFGEINRNMIKSMQGSILNGCVGSGTISFIADIFIPLYLESLQSES